MSIGADPSTPTQQLVELRKVLQSDFLSSVREVYEHVYSTVDVHANPEVRAHATAKVRLPPLNQMNVIVVRFLWINRPVVTL